LLSRVDRVREAIKRAYEYGSGYSDPGIRKATVIQSDTGPVRIHVEAEDLEMTKRISNAKQGIIHMGRL